MEELHIATDTRSQMVDVTSKLASVVASATVRRGALVAFVPHTTAGITINENADPSVPRDMLDAFTRLVPADLPYSHLEGNADAHVKASLVGSSVTIPIEDGRLQLGTWQGVYFAEFDGPRRRRLWVQLIGASGSS
jgi:secondary thiamine-phosphate synthase enzyme